MMKVLLGILVLVALSGSTLLAQDITGTWQTTIRGGTSDARVVMKISKADKGGWKVVWNSIDRQAVPFTASDVTLQGSTLKFSIPPFGWTWEGKLSADGASMAGIYVQDPHRYPLTFIRATSETAWDIPEPPKPPQPMAADANPAFEVATVKPSDPNVPGHWITVRGRQFSTHDWSLDELMEFAYGVQLRQIVSGPDWMNKDKFDIGGEPDHEGIPNPKQLKGMMQKLLADRFKLTFHHDQREMSVYALSVGKNGSKLTKNEAGGPLPGLFFRPAPGGIMLSVMNGTMADFTSLMQANVLDRPVVDQTGLADKFNFQLSWAPDESQFAGRPMGAHPGDQPPPENPLPSLFTAIQEQLGLKLEATKAPADVLVIDHVEKPSEN